MHAKVIVIGSGPGGYTAAFRAADLLGEGVVLVERYASLGGVCLNVGCIPSKALLHTASLLEDMRQAKDLGITCSKISVDLDGVRKNKDNIVNRLTGGLQQLAKMRKVQVVQGEAQFDSPKSVTVGKEKITFDHAIIAAGSRPVDLPFLPKDKRIMDSTGALLLEDIPESLLVIGGGIIGLEMATVYAALGSAITIVELSDFIIPGVDRDIATPLYKRLAEEYIFLLETKVVKAEAKKEGIAVTFEGKNAPKKAQLFDKVLCAVGRTPNGKMLGLDKAGVRVDEKGFIAVDNQQRTNVSHIFAIGDIVGQPMLAHKSIPEGRVAAEVIAGKKHFFNPQCIPSVAYTDPEIAWVGLTEKEAKEKGVDYGKGVFPWSALGRSLCLGREEGITKVLFDNKTKKIIGASIVGSNAGELIAEVALAIEMGCEAEDIALTIHPHPTLSETVTQATELYLGTATDLPNKRK
jgi:dihydrolipoamide dehydrogenase